MEPRPLKPPQRSSPPTPATPVDRASWSPSAPSNGTGFSSPIIPTAPSPTGPSRDAAAARSAWYDPAAAIPTTPSPVQPASPAGPSYSPGPTLTPIDGGRGARFLGPLLALVVLAAVVGAVVFVVLRVFDDGGGRSDNPIAAASGTVTAAAGGAGAGTVQPTQAPGAPTATAAAAVAGAEETAAPTAPTAGGATQPAAGPTEAAASTPTPKPEAPASARALLPASSDLPAGFERTEDDKRTKEEVASSFGNPDEATQLLDEWGWKENAFRTFEVPASSNPDPNSTTYVNISIHRFSSSKNASSALTYFADSVQTSQGLEEIEVEKIGDRIVALKGAPDGSNLVVLYIRSGNFLIRIGGSSPSGDPTQDVIDLAKKIVA